MKKSLIALAVMAAAGAASAQSSVTLFGIVDAAVTHGRNGADGSLATHFDESNATLKFRVTGFSPLAVHFDADIDRLDAGRYLAPNHADAAPAKNAATDLSALRSLRLDGTARIGSLQIAGARTRNLRLEIRSAQGRLDVRGSGGGG